MTLVLIVSPPPISGEATPPTGPGEGVCIDAIARESASDVKGECKNFGAGSGAPAGRGGSGGAGAGRNSANGPFRRLLIVSAILAISLPPGSGKLTPARANVGGRPVPAGDHSSAA